ncbi:nmrA-like family protein [Penicillium brasilianum]|uniref:NmrA-like family protein n=1 Tax=Penicillium brasilianum TaxID=104259 RepID=A0A1S9RSS1_PENBI|nr:nmrA-like family protein [Penicillium brasilianum]
MATILVTGATGKQGGALIKNLVQKNAPFQILAVTRNPQSPSAQKLLKESKNIKLVQGDSNDPSEIFKNAQQQISEPIWGVFSVQAAIGTKIPEDVQGKGLIDEALKHGVKHFVYTSVDRNGEKSIENPTDVPHFIKKNDIERYLIEKTKDGQMDWTILRPTAFYEDLTPDFMGKVFATAFKIALKGKPLQMVGISDIGAVAAEVFLNAQDYKGRAISLAGDELTFEQWAQIFKEKTGQDVPTTFGFVVTGILYMVKDFGYMFKWFHDVGYGADIAEVKKIHPGLKDFATWLETESKFELKK